MFVFLLVFVRLVVCLFVCLFEEKDDDDTCLAGPCPPVGWFVSLCVSFYFLKKMMMSIACRPLPSCWFPCLFVIVIVIIGNTCLRRTMLSFSCRPVPSCWLACLFVIFVVYLFVV